MTAARSDITSAAPYTLLGSFLASRGEQSAQRAPKVTFRLHPRSCRIMEGLQRMGDKPKMFYSDEEGSLYSKTIIEY